jgi:serine acetyltransferase
MVMDALIGRNVTIYQGVKIGGSRLGKYPIGDNVIVRSNARLLAVMIGDNAIIGAIGLSRKCVREWRQGFLVTHF